MRRPVFLICILFCFAQTAGAQNYAFDLLSVAFVSEEDPTGAQLEGIKLSRVFYYDDHAPPMTGFVSLEYLSGDGRDQSRLAMSFSIFEFPGGKAYSVWIRPVLGLQYRSAPGFDRFDGFAGLGAELILRPHPDVQVAATYDRILAFSGDETDQFGIALRYGFRD